MKKLLLASIISFASFSVLADSGEKTIHPLDTDKDGLISVEEAKIDSTLSALFSDLDVNQDGYLSNLEMEVKTEVEIK
jgi:hypothetical protein